MSTITKRASSQYQAKVRRQGWPVQSKTFETLADAKKWATKVESEMNSGAFIDRSELKKTTLWELLERYRLEVTPTHKGREKEDYKIRQLQRHPLASRSLSTLRAVDFSQYRDERLKKVGTETVRKELAKFAVVFKTAARDWSLPVQNHAAAIKKPAASKGRDRRLQAGEEKRLLVAAESRPDLRVAIILAIETGMRCGEIASLTWEQIDLIKQVIRLDVTKNGDPRTVPLSDVAEALIKSLPRPLKGGKFIKYTPKALSTRFATLCKAEGIVGLTFHDLRHECASRLAPTMPTASLAKLMGWRSLGMAARYYNPTDEELVSLRRGGAVAAAA